jgi:hypothetical protein
MSGKPLNRFNFIARWSYRRTLRSKKRHPTHL